MIISMVDMMVSQSSTEFRDESMLDLIPEVCRHSWVDVCVEGKTSQSVTYLVHKICTHCRHYWVETCQA